MPSFRAEGGGWFRRWFPFARAPESREREERGGAVRLELQSGAPGAWGLDSFSSARPGGGQFLFKRPVRGKTILFQEPGPQVDNSFSPFLRTDLGGGAFFLEENCGQQIFSWLSKVEKNERGKDITKVWEFKGTLYSGEQDKEDLLGYKRF